MQELKISIFFRNACEIAPITMGWETKTTSPRVNDLWRRRAIACI